MGELTYTVFKRVEYYVSGLLHYIDVGDIGLPEIQRPFVWRDTKVRDLFDSMYRGFPVGYLLFWENPGGNDGKQIGLDGKAHTVPALLVVDGQQRLASLYSVVRGKRILDRDYRERRIKIAFRPRDGRFEVADAAIRRDPEFIADISELWTSGKTSWSLVNSFLKQLEASRPLSDNDKEVISRNLDRLFDLQKYPFTALEIASAVDEEQVADIFVRINSEGVELKQADFILTLLSVFGEDIRKDLERFCRECRVQPTTASGPSPFNRFIEPTPDQLVRIAVAVGFYRARLRSVYQVIRGKDPVTETFDPVRREQQLETLRQSTGKVLDLTQWHAFLNALVAAGFRGRQLISSENTLLLSYGLYLIGRTRFDLPHHALDGLIGRWFYAASLSERYTGSFESVMESDLAAIRELADGDVFVATLSRIMAETLTNDYWQITLPAKLATSSARSPSLYAFYAAQNVLHAPVLFSKKQITDLFDPALVTNKKSLERHHLFPRAWLEDHGVRDLAQINQAANFALLEWPDNVQVSDSPPSDYVPPMRAQCTTDDEWERMCRVHALPAGWESLPYEEFLSERRKLMAGIIRQGFEALA